MARANFGGGAGDFVFTATPNGLVKLAPATLTFWTAETGGIQITDLRLNGVPVTTITVGADGMIPTFQGPDGVASLWADAGAARVKLVDEGNLDTSDGVITAIDANAGSQFRTQQDARLSATYVPRLITQAAAQIVRTFKLDPADANVAMYEIVTKAFANSGGKPANVGTWIGYNASRYTQQAGEDGEAGLLGWHMGMESGYYNPDDLTYGPEWYLNYTSPDNTSVPIATFRPLYVRLGQGDTNLKTDKWAHVLVDIGPDAEGVFAVTPGYALPTPGTLAAFRVTAAELNLSSTAVVADGGSFAVRPRAAGNVAANLIVDSKGTGIAVVAMRVAGAAAGSLIATDVNTYYLADKADNPVVVFNYGSTVAARQTNVRSRLKVDGAIWAGSDTDSTVTVADTGNLGAAPTVAGNAVRGTISMGTGAAPAAGDAVTLTVPAGVYGSAPTVVVSAGNFATSNRQPYAYAVDAATLKIGFGVALAASAAAGTYKVNYQVLG